MRVEQQQLNWFIAAAQQQMFMQDILLAHKITDSGQPNRHGCRIPLNTKWNLNIMSWMLEDYPDREVLE